MHDFGCDVFVFRHAAGAAVKDVSQVLVAQTEQRAIDLAFSVSADRTAIVFLVARRRQRIQRERIILRCRDLLFDQRTEDADFNFI